MPATRSSYSSKNSLRLPNTTPQCPMERGKLRWTFRARHQVRTPVLGHKGIRSNVQERDSQRLPARPTLEISLHPVNHPRQKCRRHTRHGSVIKTQAAAFISTHPLSQTQIAPSRWRKVLKRYAYLPGFEEAASFRDFAHCQRGEEPAAIMY